MHRTLTVSALAILGRLTTERYLEEDIIKNDLLAKSIAGRLNSGNMSGSDNNIT